MFYMMSVFLVISSHDVMVDDALLGNLHDLWSRVSNRTQIVSVQHFCRVASGGACPLLLSVLAEPVSL